MSAFVVGILGTVGFIHCIFPRLRNTCNTRCNQETTADDLCETIDITEIEKCYDILPASPALESSPSLRSNAAYEEISKS